jgi:hypothetical protein
MRREIPMAYPFRKITKRQLRKLLRDDRKRNLHLTESPDCPETDSPIYQSISIPKNHSDSGTISTESR